MKKIDETTSCQNPIAVRHTKLVSLTASFLAVLNISKCMHGLQACLFKYITAAFRIYAQRGEDAAKRGGLRPCIK